MISDEPTLEHVQWLIDQMVYEEWDYITGESNSPHVRHTRTSHHRGIRWRDGGKVIEVDTYVTDVVVPVS